jgi:KUP system potassium uptake protein
MEDEFDGANRKNLLHFIQEKHGIYSQTSQETFEGVSPGQTIDQLRGLTYVSRTLESSTDDADDYAKEKLIEKRELIRISTCSIFHKYSRGPGVPHTFVGFIRQWPALPQVVVSIVVSHVALYLLIIDFPVRLCSAHRDSSASRAVRC